MYIDIKETILQKINFIKNMELEIDDNYSDVSLFNHPFNLKPIDLVYLFFEIEKEFNINFSPVDIYEERFLTVKSIANLINENYRFPFNFSTYK